MTGLSGRSVTTRAAALLSGMALLAALAALPAGPALASPAGPARLATHPRGGTTGGTPGGGTTGGKAASPGRAGQAAARPGTNLLLNPGAQTGAVSARGWDSVTIPAWQVVSGLPTAVRYGTPRFPPATGRWPLVPGGQLFAGGAGGTARLRQSVSLRRSGSAMRYDLSAWLGGTSHSSAAVTVAFLSATGQVLGRGTTGPVGKGTGGHRLSPRAATGTVPAGAVSARVTLVLATTLTNIDGPYAPKVGYDWALADGLRFSVSAPVRRPPPLVPPAAHVPGYQHVFLFYFENEDFGSVIGNTTQAPYLNSLLPRGSLLADSFAEEHPSDGNYLALAGGSTFGVPLTDPLEINPRYTIAARNIGDLLGAAHQTWKEYLQSANGPCDDTVHGYYWDDDLPMTYFADVRNRPASCSAHLVPLQALRTDLASTATTPNFAWLGANDCADMEGCGIRAGDEFLAAELGAIERSPAWRTQRSLAIITFDEDGFDHEHPAQRVATLVLGSRGVRQGYVSHVRYTHYSLLRTIEAALGLGTLTPNDRYAQPVNDVFGHQPAPPAPAAALRTAPSTGARARGAAGRSAVSPGAAAAAGGARHPTAFVVNSASATVTPVDLTTRRAGPPITVGARPQAIAVTPDGRTAYVANSGSGTVTPINTATRRASTPIRTGSGPVAVAVTPDGRTAYVANSGSGTVTPINTATGRAGTPIRAGAGPRAIAISPGGRIAYVLDWDGAAVTPIDTATGRAGPPIRVGSYPFALAFAPDGRTAYVASYGANTVTPIDVVTGRPGHAIPAGQAPDALAVSPDGRTVYAVGGDSDTVIPIGAGTGRAGRGIPVGYSPAAIAITGSTAFVVNTISGTVTPVSTKTGHAGPPIPAGVYNYPTAITVAPGGGTAVVVGTYAGKVTLIDTRTRRATAQIKVGAYPVAAAIAG
jgi:YVTN family beta-propeller protein